MNEDELFHELFHVPLKIFRIYHAGDYERENLVLIAGEECYLSDYVLFQMVYGEDSLPDYARSHFLTFDETRTYIYLSGRRSRGNRGDYRQALSRIVLESGCPYMV